MKLAYCLLAGVIAIAGWRAGQIIIVTAVGVWLMFWWFSALQLVERLMDTKVARFWLLIGAWSFPIYILHYPLARLLLICGVAVLPADRATFLVAWVPATVVASYIAAALLHRYVEVPGMRYGKRLAEDRERRLDRRQPADVARADSDRLGDIIQSQVKSATGLQYYCIFLNRKRLTYQ